jgi:hypothetical protein
VICVGGYAQDFHGVDTAMTTSNFGSESVDLLAPGGPIRTTAPGGGYSFPSGTSMAAAFVSAEAALLFSNAPSLSVAQAVDLILGTASPRSFATQTVTGGVADAAAALREESVDSDRDGVYDLVDACPQQANATATGCPPVDPPPIATVTPTPTPTQQQQQQPPPVEQSSQPRELPAVTVTTKVSKCKAHTSCRTSATVKLKPDRTAKVRVRVDRQVCDKHHHCKWKRVLTQAVSASVRGKSITVRGTHASSLPKGTYRVVAVPSSAAGTGKTVTRTFHVR